MGALLLLGQAINGLLAIVGVGDIVVNYAGPVLDFLATGPGVLASVAFGVFLIVWAVYKRPETEQTTEAVTETEKDKELDRLRTKLREAKEDRDSLQRELYENRGARQFGSAVLPDAASPGTVDRLTNENERLRQEVGRLKDQVSEKELRQRALELSASLFRLSEEWGWLERRSPTLPPKTL